MKTRPYKQAGGISSRLNPLDLDFRMLRRKIVFKIDKLRSDAVHDHRLHPVVEKDALHPMRCFEALTSPYQIL